VSKILTWLNLSRRHGNSRGITILQTKDNLL